MRRRTMIALAALFTLPVTAGASWKSQPKPTVHAWVLPTCPSGASIKPQAALLETAVGLFVDYVFDEVGTAIAKAAEEDRKGRSSSGASPGYLYLHQPGFELDGEKHAAQSTLMGCLVVARSASGPGAWCETDGFAGETEICSERSQALFVGTYERTIDSTTEQIDFLTPAKHSFQSEKGLPDFYAEIELLASGDKTALYPELIALYYPAGLHGRKFENDDPRDLLVSVSANLPGGSSAMSTVLVRLEKIQPTPRLRMRNGGASGLPTSPQGLWVSALALNTKTHLPPPGGGGLVAVNLVAEVREIGKASPFLQLFAKWFGANKQEIAGGFKSQLLPSLSAAAAEKEATDAAKTAVEYQQTVAASFKAMASLSDVCRASAATDEEQRSKRVKVSQAFFEASIAQQKQKLSADTNKIKESDQTPVLPDLESKKAAFLGAAEPTAACDAIFQ